MFELGGRPAPRNSGFLQRMLHECETRESRQSTPPAIEKRIKWIEQQQEAKRQTQALMQPAPVQQVASQPKQAQHQVRPENGKHVSVNHLAAYSAICTRIEKLEAYDMPQNVRWELDKMISEVRELMKYC